MNHQHILLYADEKTASGSMYEALRDSFDPSAYPIIRIRADDIKNGILREATSRIFVLPGIHGEISPYTAQLDQVALKELHDFVELNNNIILTECAGSYFVSRQTIYQTGWSEPRGRMSAAPFFNGVARGPVAPYGRPADPDSPYGDIVVVPVRFMNEKGEWEDAAACYGNGPALYPDNPADPSIDIMARYSAIADAPAALLRQQFGKGVVYMSCILPEIGYRNLHPRAYLKNAATLMEDLRPHEQGRQKLWNTLVTRIQQDLKP